MGRRSGWNGKPTGGAGNSGRNEEATLGATAVRCRCACGAEDLQRQPDKRPKTQKKTVNPHFFRKQEGAFAKFKILLTFATQVYIRPIRLGVRTQDFHS